MSFTEYIFIFHSIIVGSIVTIYISGWSRMVANSSRWKFYWVQLAWSILLFLFLINHWWLDYFNTIKQDKISTLPLFLNSLVRPILLYFLAELVFPSKDERGEIVLKEYFLKNLRKLALIFTIQWIHQITVWVFRGDDLLAFSPLRIMVYISLALSIVLFYAKKNWIVSLITILFMLEFLFLLIYVY